MEKYFKFVYVIVVTKSGVYDLKSIFYWKYLTKFSIKDKNISPLEFEVNTCIQKLQQVIRLKVDCQNIDSWYHKKECKKVYIT